MARQPEAALQKLAEAEEMIGVTQEGSFEAEVHRLRGELLHAAGARPAAEACFRKAIHVAQGQSAKLWELRATVSLARLLRDQGNRAEARELLAPVYAWFAEGFDTADLEQAKALLAEPA